MFLRVDWHCTSKFRPGVSKDLRQSLVALKYHTRWAVCRLLRRPPSSQVDESNTYLFNSSIAGRWTADPSCIGAGQELMQYSSLYQLIKLQQDVKEFIAKTEKEYPIMASPQPYNLLRTRL